MEIYKILKQFVPGSNSVWVSKLLETDTEYTFDNIQDAELKREELENNDVTNRKYRIE